MSQARRNRTRRRTRTRSRGFSLVEALVSSAILGIGLLGLIRLHTSTVHGVMHGSQTITAMRIADQRLEQLATQTPDAAFLPNCPTGPDTLGCRIDPTALSTVKLCTAWVDGPDVPTPSGASSASSTVLAGYRMDVVVGAHPDAINQGSGFLATVSVCWLDERGIVQEVRSRRLLVPGT